MMLTNEVLKIEGDLINQTNDRAIVIKSLTKDLKVKTLTVLYNSEDSWNDFSMFESMEHIHSNCIRAILNDTTVIGYKSFFCTVNPDMTLTKRMESEPTMNRFYNPHN